MTRGRKKDLTIPPSRALTQQRDYRARKAAYISNLEERCRKSEEENVRLRKELELARTGLPVATLHNSDVAQASSELKQQLATASEALSRFQQLAFPEVPAQYSSIISAGLNGLRPASFPSPAPSPPSHNSATAASNRHRRPSPLEGSSSIPPRLDAARPGERPFSRMSPSPSPSLGSECCGGYLDCRDLVEREEEEEGEDAMEEDELEEESGSTSAVRMTSGMRSTSDDKESLAQRRERRSLSHDP